MPTQQEFDFRYDPKQTRGTSPKLQIIGLIGDTIKIVDSEEEKVVLTPIIKKSEFKPAADGEGDILDESIFVNGNGIIVKDEETIRKVKLYGLLFQELKELFNRK